MELLKDPKEIMLKPTKKIKQYLANIFGGGRRDLIHALVHGE